VFIGVPMSVPYTGAAQLRRLRALGHRVIELPPMRDVDRIDDAVAVSEIAPGTRFAAALRRVTGELAEGA
jgi:glycosyltransferase A (GT-A) superfamily protein (DUF2064 family)